MKAIKALFLLLGIPAMLSLNVNAEPIAKLDGDDIIIVPQPPVPPDQPRSSSSIHAFLDCDKSCIYATLSNVGMFVDVVIENHSTGEKLNYQIAGNGTTVMPISGTSGQWTIAFILSSGDKCYGEFVLF